MPNVPFILSGFWAGELLNLALSMFFLSNEESQDSLWSLIAFLIRFFSWADSELPKSCVLPIPPFGFLNGWFLTLLFLPLLLPWVILFSWLHLFSMPQLWRPDGFRKLLFADPMLLCTRWAEFAHFESCASLFGDALLHASGVLTCFIHLFSFKPILYIACFSKYSPNYPKLIYVY